MVAARRGPAKHDRLGHGTVDRDAEAVDMLRRGLIKSVAPPAKGKRRRERKLVAVKAIGEAEDDLDQLRKTASRVAKARPRPQG